MLYIAEKPELARAIVDGLGDGTRKKGFYECGLDKVTWCFGHMLQLYEPEDYDPAYKKWDMEKLPMFFVPWKKRPLEKSREQLGIILKLLKNETTVVHAGDPDAEGQLLVDELLDYAGFSGTVKRLLINDTNPVVVKKSLAALRDNADFQGLSAAAEARQIADQVFGFNLTRLYTLAARREGYAGGILSVGRVQTPILGLVVRRDREHSNHRKTPYYGVRGNFRIGDAVFTATYQNKPDDPQDDKNRLTDSAHAHAIADSLAGETAVVQSVDARDGESPPPLPYNLLKLQTDASRLYGIAPDKVKDITQTLREKHQLITYNRSDCQYLSDEQHSDAPQVITAIANILPDLHSYTDAADPSLKSRAFDSSKVTAHHAIIPTQTHADGAKLTPAESKILHLIARNYLVQFLSPQKWRQITVILTIGDHAFIHKTKVILDNGWRALHDGDGNENEETAPDLTSALHAGLAIHCDSGQCFKEETAPRPLYSMATLLEDLTRVGQYALDQKLRRSFLEKDKGKTSEHGGIGTPATRDVILRTLFDRGFIEYKKTDSNTSIVSTKAGQEFYDVLPDSVKYPDLTAIWHEQQRQIEAGNLDITTFLNMLFTHITDEIDRVKRDGLNLHLPKHTCPQCGSALVMLRGKNGRFWGCTQYPKCRGMLPDDHGKPGVWEKVRA